MDAEIKSGTGRREDRALWMLETEDGLERLEIRKVVFGC
jgi:hypothetical protein